MVINGLDVELHGKMLFSLSKRVDEGIDKVLEDLFFRRNVRSWDCKGTQVFLPSPDNDIILGMEKTEGFRFVDTGISYGCPKVLCDLCAW